jgi:kinesin family protein C2/C3
MAKRRRDACNRLQEAKGSIRVLSRCRPFAEDELARGDASCVALPSHEIISVTPPDEIGLRVPPPPVDFAFDSAFGAGCRQQDLYDEISPAVCGVLQGQYVCVMAYGQTGAGKTWTMQGGGGEKGLVQLAAEELVREASQLSRDRKAQGGALEVTFECSMLEIYNEKVLDLLNAGGGDEAASEALEIRPGADGAVTVMGLTQRPVASASEVSGMLHLGSKRRHTHATLMNAGSSRSHLVLTLHATMRGADGVEQKGRLHLVDLAGSERIGKSGVSGEQLREAQNINKSLSSLELVMGALQSRQAAPATGGGAGGGSGSGGGATHVPYRNSKLTLLLSDALGAKGSCAKTIMIMQVSPSASSAAETSRTLKFGQRCQSVTLGAVRRVSARTVDTKRAAAEDERSARLQAELLESRRGGREAEERARAAEQRAEALAERLASTQALLQQTKAAQAKAAAEQASSRVAAATAAAAAAAPAQLQRGPVSTSRPQAAPLRASALSRQAAAATTTVEAEPTAAGPGTPPSHSAAASSVPALGLDQLRAAAADTASDRSSERFSDRPASDRPTDRAMHPLQAWGGSNLASPPTGGGVPPDKPAASGLTSRSVEYEARRDASALNSRSVEYGGRRDELGLGARPPRRTRSATVKALSPRADAENDSPHAPRASAVAAVKPHTYMLRPKTARAVLSSVSTRHSAAERGPNSARPSARASADAQSARQTRWR